MSDTGVDTHKYEALSIEADRLLRALKWILKANEEGNKYQTIRVIKDVARECVERFELFQKSEKHK